MPVTLKIEQAVKKYSSLSVVNEHTSKVQLEKITHSSVKTSDVKEIESLVGRIESILKKVAPESEFDFALAERRTKTKLDAIKPMLSMREAAQALDRSTSYVKQRINKGRIIALREYGDNEYYIPSFQIDPKNKTWLPHLQEVIASFGTAGDVALAFLKQKQSRLNGKSIIDILLSAPSKAQVEELVIFAKRSSEY